MKRLFPIFFIYMLAIFGGHRASAQCVFTSNSAGNWNAITWTKSGTGCGANTTPGANDNVVINHAVTISTNLTITLASLTINDVPNPAGSLSNNAGTVLNLTVSGNMVVGSGNNRTATFTVRGATSTVNIGNGTTPKGSLFVGRDDTFTVDGARVNIYGLLDLSSNNSTLTINNSGTVVAYGGVTAANSGNVNINTSTPGANTGTFVANQCNNGNNGNGNSNNYIANNLNYCLLCATGSTSNIITVNACITLLPIELMFFQAIHQAATGTVHLAWATAREIDNRFFTVERSANGKDFAEILRIEGAGTSHTTRNYSIEDKAPLTGTSYYRLRQTDLDGTSTLSKTVAVYIDPGQAATSQSLLVYPNPLESNELFVTFDYATPTGVEVLDATGRSLEQVTWQYAGGSTHQLQVRLGQKLAPGVYFVKVKLPATALVQRFVAR